MSDVIETLDKNIKTLELLENEYAKRATPRMKYASIRSALNNAIISLKKTKDRYSKEPQECNSGLISKKNLIEDLSNKFRKVVTDEDLEWNRCLDMTINSINNQPQVQPIVRTPEEVTEMLNKISCPDCDRNSSHCHFSETECKNYWYEWLTKKEV